MRAGLDGVPVGDRVSGFTRYKKYVKRRSQMLSIVLCLMRMCVCVIDLLLGMMIMMLLLLLRFDIDDSSVDDSDRCFLSWKTLQFDAFPYVHRGSCFTGADVVAWLTAHKVAHTEAEAVIIGRAFLAKSASVLITGNAHLTLPRQTCCTLLRTAATSAIVICCTSGQTIGRSRRPLHRPLPPAWPPSAHPGA